MTRSMRKPTRTVRIYVSAILGIWLTTSSAYAGTVTIAVTPSVIDAVDTVAQAFEAAHAGDRVRIVVNSETELKGSIKNLPVQLVASDDSSLIEWMEARDVARRPAMAPAISVPLAVVASSSDAAVFGSTGDLLNRMKQQGIVIAIPDPQKIDCGRRAQALLKTVGVECRAVRASGLRQARRRGSCAGAERKGPFRSGIRSGCDDGQRGHDSRGVCARCILAGECVRSEARSAGSSCRATILGIREHLARTAGPESERLRTCAGLTPR